MGMYVRVCLSVRRGMRWLRGQVGRAGRRWVVVQPLIDGSAFVETCDRASGCCAGARVDELLHMQASKLVRAMEWMGGGSLPSAREKGRRRATGNGGGVGTGGVKIEFRSAGAEEEKRVPSRRVRDDPLLGGSRGQVEDGGANSRTKRDAPVSRRVATGT
jgi:hypothetical protein